MWTGIGSWSQAVWKLEAILTYIGYMRSWRPAIVSKRRRQRRKRRIGIHPKDILKSDIDKLEVHTSDKHAAKDKPRAH